MTQEGFEGDHRRIGLLRLAGEPHQISQQAAVARQSDTVLAGLRDQLLGPLTHRPRRPGRHQLPARHPRLDDPGVAIGLAGVRTVSRVPRRAQKVACSPVVLTVQAA
jgi:hypothetical protein